MGVNCVLLIILDQRLLLVILNKRLTLRSHEAKTLEESLFSDSLNRITNGWSKECRGGGEGAEYFI